MVQLLLELIKLFFNTAVDKEYILAHPAKRLKDIWFKE
jgi:hypothetical protein